MGWFVFRNIKSHGTNQPIFVEYIYRKRQRLLYHLLVNNMVADEMAGQWAGISAAMVLTQLFWNIPYSASGGPQLFPCATTNKKRWRNCEIASQLGPPHLWHLLWPYNGNHAIQRSISESYKLMQYGLRLTCMYVHHTYLSFLSSCCQESEILQSNIFYFDYATHQPRLLSNV